MRTICFCGFQSHTEVCCPWISCCRLINTKTPHANTYGAYHANRQIETFISSSLHKTRSLFFHPDYTVGPGVTPGQPPKRVADFTASRELHPAPKNIMVISLLAHYSTANIGCKARSTDFKHKFALLFFRIDLLDMCTNPPKLLREILISSLNILDIEDFTVVIRRQRCDHKGRACAQVR